MRERPAFLLVMGILNIIFASLGLLGSFCGVAGLLILQNLSSSLTPPGGPNPLNIFNDVDRELPGYLLILYVTYILSTLMYIVLLVSGIGLIRVRRWGRLTAIIYVIYALTSSCLGGAYAFLLVMPATQRVSEASGLPYNPVTQLISTVAGPILIVIYSIVLLIAIFMPRSSAAFVEWNAE